MDSAYELRVGPPSLDDYLRLRSTSGLTPKTADQGERALPGSWFAVHVVHVESGQTVGMGRVIGDGGWYFHIVDMATLPDHQRRGIGDAVMSTIVSHIRSVSPPNPFITLLADEPGRPLYRRHGFVETAPGSLGMALPVNGTPPSDGLV